MDHVLRVLDVFWPLLAALGVEVVFYFYVRHLK